MGPTIIRREEVDADPFIQAYRARRAARGEAVSDQDPFGIAARMPGGIENPIRLNNHVRPPNQNEAENQNGPRARSTQVRHPDGSVSNVINIGVPEDHPMADRSSQAGPTGLYNMRLGNVRIPAAPQFTINVRRQNAG